MTVHKGEFEVAVIPENYKGDSKWKRNPSFGFDEVISLPHLSPYSIKVKSFSTKRADAIITIDGNEIYTQRISPNRTHEYTSLPNTKGQFTFIQEGTQEFKDAGLYDVHESDRGIVKVTIIPERDEVLQTYSKGVTRSFGGGTGLTGETTQSFVKVGDINRDYNRKLEFTFKLIPATNIVKPLVADADDDIDLTMFVSDDINLIIQQDNHFRIASETELPKKVKDIVYKLQVMNKISIDREDKRKMICIVLDEIVYIKDWLERLKTAFEVNGVTQKVHIKY